MMKRMSWVVVLGAALGAATVADAATIVAVSGDVRVKAAGAASWQAAAKGQAVSKDTEIQCGPQSRCTVAFDELLRNIATVKENTTMTVEELQPGQVFLKEGRVFAIIRAAGSESLFRVRTPTAISGARGTAWLTDFRTGRTEVSVFEDDVVVSGIDAAGTVTGEVDVATGQGVSVAADGLIGEIFVVPFEQFDEWYKEKQGLEALLKEFGVAPPAEAKTEAAPAAAASAGSTPQEPKKEDATGAMSSTGPVPVAGERPPMTEGEKLSSEPSGSEPLPEERPMGEETMTEEPTTNEGSAMDESITEEPMMDESAMDESTMEPRIDEPMMDEPMFDQERHEDVTDPDTTNQQPPPHDSGGGSIT